MTVIPPTQIFRFRLPVRQANRLPRRGKALLNLGMQYRLVFPGVIDGAPDWARMRAGWTPSGIGFSVEVAGGSLGDHPESPEQSTTAGLQLWIDTRNTQSVHRATRFCHHFSITPSGGTDRPRIEQLTIPRARDDAPRSTTPPIACCLTKRGSYTLEVWFPADALHGFDPSGSPLLGFHARIQDRRLGEVFLAHDQEFPCDADPSLWSTLELVGS